MKRQSVKWGGMLLSHLARSFDIDVAAMITVLQRLDYMDEVRKRPTAKAFKEKAAFTMMKKGKNVVYWRRESVVDGMLGTCLLSAPDNSIPALDGSGEDPPKYSNRDEVSKLKEECERLRSSIKSREESVQYYRDLLQSEQKNLVAGLKKQYPPEFFDIYHIGYKWYLFLFQPSVDDILQPIRFFVSQMLDDTMTSDMVSRLNVLLAKKNKGERPSPELMHYFRTQCSVGLIVQLVAHELLPPNCLLNEIQDMAIPPLDLPNTLDSPNPQ
jgi:hypothetical protein